MKSDNSPDHGQWVFRNNRWYFLPRDASFVEPVPGSVDKEALASLVDPSELTRVLQPSVAVSGLPIVVYFLAGRTEVDEWDRTNPDVSVGYPEWLMPPWYHDLAAIHPSVEAFFKDNLEAAAQRAVIRGKQTVLDSVLGPKSFLAETIGFSYHGKTIIHGAVSMLARTTVPSPGDSELCDQLELSPEQCGEIIESLRNVLPDEKSAGQFVDLVKLNVNAYAARVQDVFVHRMELAAEQGRARHYFVRAEALEKRMLSSTSDLDDSVTGSRGVVEELDTLLDLPGLGITVEDSDHTVRYLNPMMVKLFGNAVGRKCYEALKGRKEPCTPCIIKSIWQEGQETVIYQTQDPRTRRHFHVLAAPMVSRTGERLVLEVGVDVTDTVREQSALQKKVTVLAQRNQQLMRMGDTIRNTLLDACHGLGQGIMANAVNVSRLVAALQGQDKGESARVRGALDLQDSHLTKHLGRLSDVAVALSIDETPRSVDVETMVRSIASDLRPDEVGSIDLTIAVMPRLTTVPAILRRLLESLLDYFVDQQTEPLALKISHTMSGTVHKITSGDSYHVLPITGPCRSPSNCTEDAMKLAQLLALRLGGNIWTVDEEEEMETCLLTLPVSLA